MVLGREGMAAEKFSFKTGKEKEDIASKME